MPPIFKIIARFFPGLEDKLVQAGILEKPEKFVRKSFFIAFYVTTFVIVGMSLVLIRLQTLKWFSAALFPVLLLVLFFNFIKRPDVIIRRKQREFDREVVFAGKFLVIELQSGVPVYDAMKSVAHSYPIIGRNFREITNRVDIGTPVEDAINQSIDLTPSANFRKLLWQLYNSLKTGADLAPALKVNIDQIAADQIIQVREYGKKLNPMVMFYMVVAVIFPSIGIIMFIVFSGFLAISINLTILLLVAGFVGLVQVLFLLFIRSQRPAVGLQ
ncbi:type II secretion system F family protein [Candidatus Woesearchaeota archaeon]|nr:type II secretion system F family protein [Candidatus Woesearchaeota archaeon]